MDINEIFIDESADSKYNKDMKRLLYQQRVKNDKEVLLHYKKIKSMCPQIKHAYIKPDMYKKENLFVDLQYYHNLFMNNNTYNMDRGINLYFDFLIRLLEMKTIRNAGYKNFYIFVYVDKDEWKVKQDTDIFDYKENINIFSTILKMLKLNPVKLENEFSKYSFIFINEKGYFTIDFSKFDIKESQKFVRNINTMLDNRSVIVSDDNNADSTDAIVNDIVDKLEDNTGIKINNLTGNSSKTTKKEIEDKVKTTKIKSNDDKKDELVNIIKTKAEINKNTEDTLDSIDNDENASEYVKDVLSELIDDGEVKKSAARSARIAKVKDTFLSSKRNGKTIKEIISTPEGDRNIPEVSLNIDTINDEWKHLKFANFNKAYDLDSDILRILNSFSSDNKSTKVAVLDVTTEDTSTSEDYIVTYTVKMEDENGKRFTLKFDIPKFKNNRFMRLRGNEKTISGQLVLLPVIKTAEDTVQIVSNYNKIFIRRYGTASGKSISGADRLLKALSKEEIVKSNKIKVIEGNNINPNSKYNLPIDYLDLSASITRIETPKAIIYLNQDEIRNKYIIDDKKGIPYAYDKEYKLVLYYSNKSIYTMATDITELLSSDEQFRDIRSSIKPATKYTYSKASIMSTEIPIIVILGYNIGLEKAMELAEIEYYIKESLEKTDREKLRTDFYGFVKFEDGYIIYQNNYSSSMLMNGMKECDTANYSLKALDSKLMWLDFLDNFGGRTLADGLDNFADLMVDPITAEVCDKFNIPTNYYEQLIYANNLLIDNKYNKHVDITGNRYRSNEIVAGYLYKVLAKSYGDYKNKMKRTNQSVAMTIKQSAVIDAILSDPTAADLSILNPLLEIEASNSVTFKGLSGMNSDRSYGLDKRTYDDTMLNVLALSTNTAANVGINRQATIDMNVDSVRGYIKHATKDELSITKSFCMTEALTPFGTTRDDPFRTGMTFTQTAKHGMRVKTSSPQLITNGADEALPYLTSDTFAFKAKGDGKIVELVEDEYMIVEYKDGTSDFINLKEKVKKNSDGGFYVTIKLSSSKGMKVGKIVKQGDILAYDKLSYSDKFGATDNIAYNIGTLCKTAIMTTDEGYEDSTIISEWMSDALSSGVVVMAGHGGIVLPKNTNLYYIVEPGQKVQEGEPLLIFQNAFDDVDANILLKNITDDDEILSDLGRIPIKAKYTGVIQDINIYRTVEKDELSDSLKKLVDKYERNINKTKAVMKKYNIEDVNSIEPTVALEASGKLKNAQDSILIEIYIKYDDKLGVGDKIVATSACKGVVKDIFPLNNEPTSEFRPTEPIHTMFAVGSFNARMITSVLVQGAINKGLIELDRKVKDIMDIPYDLDFNK